MAALEVKAERTHESALAALFAEARANLPGTVWLQPLRTEALARVIRDGLPHRRVEAWKYTDLRNKLSADLTLATGKGEQPPSLFEGVGAHRIDINGGKVTQTPRGDDLPDGLEVISLAEAMTTPAAWLRQWFQPGNDVLQNLNLAFAADGALIRVGRGLQIDRPVLLRSTLAEAGAISNTRSVVYLEEGAELTLIELEDGAPETQSLANAMTSIVLEPGARLHHLRVTASAGAGVIVRNHDLDLARDAIYEGVVLSSGAALARQQMSVRLTGAGADFNLACAYATGDGEHTDYTLEISHDAPHTKSRLLAKGVAAGSGHAAIQGRVIVKPQAQKTDSHQMSRALLLSPHAEIDQKPELEIFADDVKCGHGAAIGAVDPNQMFYLRARGIPELQARNMLVAAFLGEVTERVPATFRNAVEAWLTGRMATVGAAPQ
jgi:Fe-S cluster assembly protein SufD